MAKAQFQPSSLFHTYETNCAETVFTADPRGIAIITHAKEGVWRMMLTWEEYTQLLIIAANHIRHL